MGYKTLSDPLAARALRAASSMMGNNTGAPANVVDLTVAQTLALLGAFSLLNKQIFTITGANTYTPTAGMKFCLAIFTGAGGGGGGAITAAGAGQAAVGGGGGAGATCVSVISATTIGASKTITVGAAGGGGSGTTGADGVNGGFTNITGVILAGGGTKGIGSGSSAVRVQKTAGGNGGNPTTGDIKTQGGYGIAGSAWIISVPAVSDTVYGLGGQGGSSYWGSATQPVVIAVDGTSGFGQTPSLTAPFGTGGTGSVCIGTTNGGAGANGSPGANGIAVMLEFG